MPWRSYLKVRMIGGGAGERSAGFCVESPDREFRASRLVTVEPPRAKTAMKEVPTPPQAVTAPPPAPVHAPMPIAMSREAARLMAKPKAGRSRP